MLIFQLFNHELSRMQVVDNVLVLWTTSLLAITLAPIPARSPTASASAAVSVAGGDTQKDKDKDRSTADTESKQARLASQIKEDGETAHTDVSVKKESKDKDKEKDKDTKLLRPSTQDLPPQLMIECVDKWQAQNAEMLLRSFLANVESLFNELF